MPCELEQDSVKTFPGLTLFSKRGSACRKPTAVYLPPKHLATNHALNVVLWLHGFYVKDHRYLFHSDAARVREQVLGHQQAQIMANARSGQYDQTRRHQDEQSSGGNCLHRL